MKSQNFVKLMLALTALVLLIATLTGCYTEKKATKQAVKAINVYPLKMLPIFRGQYPCVTTNVTHTIDSTAYLSSLDSIRLLTDFYNALMEGIEPTVITSYDTIYLKECANYIKEIARKDKIIALKDKYIADFAKKTKEIAPIVDSKVNEIEDLSAITEMDLKLTKALQERDKLQKSNDKWKKWFFILAATFGIAIFLRIKKIL